MGPSTVRTRYVERMGAALTSAGLPRLPARVFAALTVDDDGRMTSAELSRSLGISAASVSSAIGLLTRINFVHRERERGSRRDVYVVDDDAWLSAIGQQHQVYAPLITLLEETLAELEPGAGSRHRLQLMGEFLTFVTAEMDGIRERWLAHRAMIESGTDEQEARP